MRNATPSEKPLELLCAEPQRLAALLDFGHRHCSGVGGNDDCCAGFGIGTAELLGYRLAPESELLPELVAKARIGMRELESEVVDRAAANRSLGVQFVRETGEYAEDAGTRIARAEDGFEPGLAERAGDCLCYDRFAQGLLGREMMMKRAVRDAGSGRDVVDA